MEHKEDPIINNLLELQEHLRCKRTLILEIVYDRVVDVDSFNVRIMVLDHATAT